MNDAAYAAIEQESWPLGLVRFTPLPHRDLALVTRTPADSRRETRMLDALEKSNRRALQAWHDSGRTLR